MNMKRQFLLTGLTLFLLGLLGLPAGAKKEVWFERYDNDADGMWSYNEFAAANERYFLMHPNEECITAGKLKRQFDDFDTNRDGLVRVEEVRRYHTWD